MNEKPIYTIERQHRLTESDIWWPVGKHFYESEEDAEEWIKVQSLKYDSLAEEYDYRIHKIWTVVIKSQILS